MTIDFVAKIVKEFLIMMTLIDETKIELTTKRVFANDFLNIKIVNLTMINNNTTKTSTNDEFVKDFRFEIMTTKLCLTKNFCEMICWLNEFVNIFANLFDKMIVVFMIFSYTRIKFAILSSFDKLRQSSNFDSYSRQRIKYSNSRRLI